MLRSRLAAELKLYDPKAFHYSWVIKFPLLAWDAEENRYAAEHHPFTMPLPEDLHLLDTDPAGVRAQAYDLVINGEEAGGGTIRIHDSTIQAKVFSLLGLDPRTGRGVCSLAWGWWVFFGGRGRRFLGFTPDAVDCVGGGGGSS